MKTCKGCQRRLPASEFWKRESSTDGLQFRCKECQRPGYRDRHKAAERLRAAEYGRAWRTANATHVSDYRGRVRERNAAQARAYRYRVRVATHLQETEAVYTLWHSLNGSGERAEPIDPRAVVAHWEATGMANTCRNGCGNAWREIVHAVPLYEGGEHTPANLVPQCRKPNCSPAGLAVAATATNRPSTSTT
ncbi:HNH endonuclease [Streptomyces phage Sycamore]|uniref:HNH endonuclease n=1 Tax=Streptomyces phage Sycamore TaxID=2767589 RepID=A0A873WND4_9CAUD|nr:HNH endonuclease [Streptomyces phage Sycamore]